MSVISLGMSMNNKEKRKLYERQLEALSEIINKWDPYGLIEGGSPKDEFSDEVSKILSGLKGAKLKEDFARTVSDVFSKNFESDHFDQHKCSEIGGEIYHFWINSYWVE